MKANTKYVKGKLALNLFNISGFTLSALDANDIQVYHVATRLYFAKGNHDLSSVFLRSKMIKHAEKGMLGALSVDNITEKITQAANKAIHLVAPSTSKKKTSLLSNYLKDPISKGEIFEELNPDKIKVNTTPEINITEHIDTYVPTDKDPDYWEKVQGIIEARPPDLTITSDMKKLRSLVKCKAPLSVGLSNEKPLRKLLVCVGCAEGARMGVRFKSRKLMYFEIVVSHKMKLPEVFPLNGLFYQRLRFKNSHPFTLCTQVEVPSNDAGIIAYASYVGTFCMLAKVEHPIVQLEDALETQNAFYTSPKNKVA